MDFDAYHNADSAGKITLTKEMLLTAAKRINAKVDFEYDSFKDDLESLSASKMNWSYEVTDSISQDQYYESIAAFCALGYDMIYAPGNQYTDAVLQAVEEYPNIAFALLNGEEATPAKAVNGNVSSLLPNAQQIG